MDHLIDQDHYSTWYNMVISIGGFELAIFWKCSLLSAEQVLFLFAASNNRANANIYYSTDCENFDDSIYNMVESCYRLILYS